MRVATTPAITEAERLHANCVVCGQNNPRGLGIRFNLAADGSVWGNLRCSDDLMGYPGRLHGGMVATLLDGAMTHCLFAHGHVGVTARLNVRYHHPILTREEITVRGWIEEINITIFATESSLEQGGRVCATATARFMSQPNLVRH